MKRCPYCAEEIQEEAVKCRYCMEFLGEERIKHPPPAPLRPDADPPKPTQPWYYKTSFLVLMFLSFPPFVLPFVWMHPSMHVIGKIAVTMAVIAFCWVSWVAIRAFLMHFFELAEMIQKMSL